MEKKVLHGLCACSLFQGMSSEEISQLMSLVGYKLVSYKKKDIYLLAGMPCKFADIVIEGQLVARMVSLSGKSVEVSRLNVGDLLSPAFIFAHDNTMPVSQEIAESFGIQKFSLLRCMSELVEVGAIKVEGKIITILDKNKM